MIGLGARVAEDDLAALLTHLAVVLVLFLLKVEVNLRVFKVITKEREETLVSFKNIQK